MQRAALDTRPLLAPVRRAEVREYEVLNGFRRTGAGTTFVGVIVMVFLLGMAIAIVALLLAFVLMLVLGAFAEMPGFAVPFEAIMPVAVAGAAALVGFIAFHLAKAQAINEEMRYRVSRFAAANELEFVPRHADPELPGMIFSLGGERVASEIVRLRQPRPVEIANYRYTITSTKTHETFGWSYIAITLDRQLPHIVLDSRDNNSKLLGSNLPVPLALSQQLSLEGDFDRHFTLHCPDGYEADALYLFTPDIMARFIDTSSKFDVEIVDDRVFLYSHISRPFSSADPEMWQWVFATVDALNEKFDQWERWRDERLSESTSSAASTASTSSASPQAETPMRGSKIPKGVAPQGRRLRHRIPLLAVLPIVVMVGVWFLIPLLER